MPWQSDIVDFLGCIGKRRAWFLSATGRKSQRGKFVEMQPSCFLTSAVDENVGFEDDEHEV